MKAVESNRKENSTKESSMKTIRKIHQARRADVADLVTRQALPISPGGLEQLDPFIFSHHHGLQIYPLHNHGLPFRLHPHRGFEIVTFILTGDLVYKETGGDESQIKAGGIQWMTAESGLIHAEVSSMNLRKRAARWKSSSSCLICR